MSTLVQYIQEHGNHTFNESSFNEVDGLILSHASLFDYSVIEESEDCTFSALRGAKQMRQLVEVSEDKASDFQLVQAMHESKRFKNIEILAYESIVSYESKENFGAVAYQLPNNEGVVAFKGSDATFLSWEENFNLAFLEPIPSLRSATQFLKGALADSALQHHVVGHSKGGYLATGASLTMPRDLQKKIVQVHNYDGPGIFQMKDMKERLDRFQPEIHKYITESSFVGRLFEKSDQFRVIESTATGFAQHRPHTWKVNKDSFVYLPKTSFMSNWLGTIFNTFVDQLDDETAPIVVETLFNVLNESEFTSFADFKDVNVQKIHSIYKQRAVLDKELFQAVIKMIKLIFIAVRWDMQETVVTKTTDKKETIINHILEYKGQLMQLIQERS